MKKFAAVVAFAGMIAVGLGLFVPPSAKAAEFSFQSSRGGFSINSGRSSGGFRGHRSHSDYHAPRERTVYRGSYRPGYSDNSRQWTSNSARQFDSRGWSSDRYNGSPRGYDSSRRVYDRHESHDNHHHGGRSYNSRSYTVTPHGNHFHVTRSSSHGGGYWRP